MRSSMIMPQKEVDCPWPNLYINLMKEGFGYVSILERFCLEITVWPSSPAFNVGSNLQFRHVQRVKGFHRLYQPWT